MLDYKELLYFYFSLIFFLLLLNSAGLYDYSSVPAGFSCALFFIFGLFFYFQQNHIHEKKSILLLRLNLLNVLFYGLITQFSYCIEISYIDLSKHLCGSFLLLSIFYAISTYDDLRSFIKTFIYFIEIYILMTMCYYFYFKYAAGAFFSGICYTMFYPYYYATLVLAITPISLYLYFTSEYKNPKEKLNFLILFLICCLNVFLTSSRIAQITLIISVFVMLCHFYRLKEHKPEAKMIVSIFLIALLVGGLFATDAFFRIAKSFSTQENFDLHDENGRLNIYKGALKTFLDYPLTGVGPALSSMFITKYRVSKLCITDCHNIVLNRLCETGIFYAFFSFSVLLTTLYLTFKFAFLNGHTVKTDGPNGGDNNLSSAALASFMSLLVVYLQGFSMPHSFLTSLVYLEYIIIALCISSVKIAGLKNYSGGQSVTNVIDFTFSKKNMRISSLISFVIVFCFFIKILNGEKIAFFIQWLLNISFLTVCAIIFITCNKNAAAVAVKNIVTKLFITFLIMIQLLFQWRVFDSGFLCQIGINHNLEGKNEKALEYFESSVNLYPNMTSKLFLSSLYYKAGEIRKALAAAYFYTSRLPYEIFGLNNLAACLIESGRTVDAASVLYRLDRYSAKNYMSAFYGAFSLVQGGRKNGIEKYSIAAAENPEFISNKFFCAFLLQSPELIGIFNDSMSAYYLNLVKSNPSFISQYIYSISAGIIVLQSYGFDKSDFFSKTEMNNRYNKLFLLDYLNSIPDSFKFLLACHNETIFTLASYPRFALVILPGLHHDAQFFLNKVKEYNPVSDYMRSIKKYKSYELYKKNLDSTSFNYSAHFGLKYWFDFENAMIDAYGVFEPAPKIPLFLTLTLKSIFTADAVKAYIKNYYRKFYITE